MSSENMVGSISSLMSLTPCRKDSPLIYSDRTRDSEDNLCNSKSHLLEPTIAADNDIRNGLTVQLENLSVSGNTNKDESTEQYVERNKEEKPTEQYVASSATDNANNEEKSAAQHAETNYSTEIHPSDLSIWEIGSSDPGIPKATTSKRFMRVGVPSPPNPVSDQKDAECPPTPKVGIIRLRKVRKRVVNFNVAPKGSCTQPKTPPATRKRKMSNQSASTSRNAKRQKVESDSSWSESRRRKRLRRKPRRVRDLDARSTPGANRRVVVRKKKQCKKTATDRCAALKRKEARDAEKDRCLFSDSSASPETLRYERFLRKKYLSKVERKMRTKRKRQEQELRLFNLSAGISQLKTYVAKMINSSSSDETTESEDS